MPPNPLSGIVTDAVHKASGAEVEMTPLTAVDPDEEFSWRRRFVKQMNRELRNQTSNSSSDRPPVTPSLELPRKVRVTQKKRVSKWRLIFMIVFVISVLVNIAFVTLFTYWYVRFKQARDIWNQTFPLSSTPTPSPSAT